MSIGTGIAIAGVWIFAGMCAIARTVTSTGMLIAIGVAWIVTMLLGGQ